MLFERVTINHLNFRIWSGMVGQKLHPDDNTIDYLNVTIDNGTEPEKEDDRSTVSCIQRQLPRIRHIQIIQPPHSSPQQKCDQDQYENPPQYTSKKRKKSRA